MRTASLITAAFLTAAASAQQYTEKIDVSLVNVDVTVTSHGDPARGLTREDFEVFEDGVLQPITNFYEVAPPVATRIASPAQTPPDDLSTDDRFRRKILLIVDNRHVSMYDRDRALKQIERFVDEKYAGGTYDWSIVVISNTAHMLLPLTSDKDRVHEAVAEIRRMVTRPEMATATDEVQRVIQPVEIPTGLSPTIDDLKTVGDRSERLSDMAATVGALHSTITSFSGAPGRKIILFVTGPFGQTTYPLTAGSAAAPGASSAAARITSLRNAIIRDANASNVSFYIINANGLKAPSDAGQAGMLPFLPGGEGDFSFLYWAARETGGRLFAGNAIDESLRDFDRVSSSFYSLAFKASHPDDNKYHAIKVRVKKPGYALQYRTGYSSIPVATQLARAMESSMAVSMQTTSIPIAIETGEPKLASKGVLVPLRATVPARDLQFLPSDKDSVAHVDVYVSLFDARGRRIAMQRFAREAHAESGSETRGEFIEERELLVKRGEPYRIVVGVHDQVTDAIGLASRVVKF